MRYLHYIKVYTYSGPLRLPNLQQKQFKAVFRVRNPLSYFICSSLLKEKLKSGYQVSNYVYSYNSPPNKRTNWNCVEKLCFVLNLSWHIKQVACQFQLCSPSLSTVMDQLYINPLTSNNHYSGRTALLTSKVAFYIFIQQTQLLNILNMVYTPRFFS